MFKSNNQELSNELLVQIHQANQHFDETNYKLALEMYQNAWPLLEKCSEFRSDRDFIKSKYLMNWGISFTKFAKHDQAIEKYELILKMLRRLFVKKDFEFYLLKARLFSNWGDAKRLIDQNKNAIKLYTKAWEIYENYLQNDERVIVRKAHLLFVWGIACDNNGQHQDGIQIFRRAWEIYESKSKEDLLLNQRRADLLNSLALTLRNNGESSEALCIFEKTWFQYHNENSDFINSSDSSKVFILYNWAETLFGLGRYEEALSKFEAAISICKKLPTDSVGKKLGSALIYIANMYSSKGDLRISESYFSQAHSLYFDKLKGNSLYDYQRIELLREWAKSLFFHQQFLEAIRKIEDAWSLTTKLKFKTLTENQYDELAIDILTIWCQANASNLQKDSNALRQSIKKLEICWDILGKYRLTKKIQYDYKRVHVLFAWGKILFTLNEHEEADKKFKTAWSKYLNASLRNNSIFDHMRVCLLTAWAVNTISENKSKLLELALEILNKNKSSYFYDLCYVEILYAQFIFKYDETSPEKAKTSLNLVIDKVSKLPHYHPESAKLIIVFKFIRNLISLLSEDYYDESLHRTMKDDSAEMRSRILLIDQYNNTNFGQLNKYYSGFHQLWLQLVIDNRKHEYIPEILSYLSAWRNTQNLLEMINSNFTTIKKNEAEDDLTKTILLYKKIRNRVNQIVTALKQYETIDLNKSISISDDNLDLHQNSNQKVTQTVLNLKNEYNKAYSELSAITTKFKELPKLNFLGADFHIKYDELQVKLKTDDAILLTIQLKVNNPDHFPLDRQFTELNGFLWLTRDSIEWIKSDDDFAKANTFIHFYEKLVTGRAVRKSRHTVMSMVDDAYKKVADLNEDNVWSEYQSWMQATLWKRIAHLVADKEQVYLIPHGETQHVNWELGAPEHLNIVRYPNLAMFAIQQGMVPYKAPPVSKNKSIGIVTYKGKGSNVPLTQDEEEASENSNLPFVKAEAELVSALWGEHAHTDYDVFASHAKNECVGTLYVAGHGHHSDNHQEAHKAHLLIGENKALTVVDIMRNTDTPPSRVMLSTCLSGRSSEQNDGDLVGISTAFIQKGTRSVIAATLSVDDGWMMALMYLTEKLIKQKSTTKKPYSPALALKQAKNALKNRTWVELAPEILESWIDLFMAEIKPLRIGDDKLPNIIYNYSNQFEHEDLISLIGEYAENNYLGAEDKRQEIETKIVSLLETCHLKTPPALIMSSLDAGVIVMGDG